MNGNQTRGRAAWYLSFPLQPRFPLTSRKSPSGASQHLTGFDNLVDGAAKTDANFVCSLTKPEAIRFGEIVV